MVEIIIGQEVLMPKAETQNTDHGDEIAEFEFNIG
tara:strand:- start:347 stop:451 length:105 start_codon:yes stop_codon:yes gene_type:complete